MSDNLKYSCCWYESETIDLMQAEINMIEKTIIRAEISSNQQILDLGCGSGENTFLISSKVNNVLGIDYDKFAIKNANKPLDRIYPEAPISDTVQKILCFNAMD